MLAAWVCVVLAALAAGDAQKGTPPTEDCSRIGCAAPLCLHGYRLVILEGNCCPSCQKCPARLLPCPRLVCDSIAYRDPCGCPVCTLSTPPATETFPTTVPTTTTSTAALTTSTPQTTERECGITGQVFTRCGTACPPVCGEARPLFCTMQCVSGCQCPSGLSLNRDAEECVTECPDTTSPTTVPPTKTRPIPEDDPTSSGPPPTKTKPIPEVDPISSGPPPTKTKPIPEVDPTTSEPVTEVVTATIPAQGAPSFCSLEPDSGPCKARLRRYHFNSTSGRCETFVFGGCQGNENNFRRRRDCRKTCRKPQQTSTPTVHGTGSTNPTGTGSVPTRPTTSSVPPNPTGSRPTGTITRPTRPTRPTTGRPTTGGPTTPTKSTDATGSTPTKFTLTGTVPAGSKPTAHGSTSSAGSRPTTAPARGSAGTVQLHTAPVTVTMPTTNPICSLGKKKGMPCLDAPVKRYFYNVKKNKCKTFAYRGCRGNANRFTSREECETACM